VPYDLRRREAVTPSAETALAWTVDGQRRVEVAVAGLSNASASGPSALPGWSRGHVLTHLARNADALVNLLSWARTGVPAPMYPGGPDQRAFDIEAGAARPIEELSHDLRQADARFEAAASNMPADAWEARVVSASGREIPAADVVWLRTREVWLHLVDLSVGFTVDDIREDVAWELVLDVAGWMSTRVERAFELVVPGRESVRMGPGPSTGRVQATANALAGWLTGRDDAPPVVESGTPPQLPPWL
jgi:maleylpyruvate isomerase